VGQGRKIGAADLILNSVAETMSRPPFGTESNLVSGGGLCICRLPPGSFSLKEATDGNQES
jgi:hypothetical protein